MRVFVYGTLKKGKSAHVLMDGCTFIDEVALHDYSLLGNSPAIVPNPGGWVIGELYEFDDPDILRALDAYEGYHGGISGNLYNREVVTVGSDDTSYTDTFVYVYNHPTYYSLDDLRNGAW